MNHETTQHNLSRWATSKSLARSAWRVLKLDNKLAKIPLLSALATLTLAAIAGLVVLFTTRYTQTGSDFTVAGPLVSASWVALLFYAVVYFALTFVGVYFSAALIAGLLERYKGGAPTVRSALAAAHAHRVSLLKFSMLTGTVGYVLQAVEEHSPLAGRVATWVVGAAWSVASMFAVPVIVSGKEEVGPLAATRQSVEIIKKTWGESAILTVGVGLVAALTTGLFVFVMAALGFIGSIVLTAVHASSVAVGVGAGALGFVAVLGICGLALLFTLLSAVVKAAIYHYATTGETPAGFERDIIRSSFTTSKARKVFGL